MKAIPTTLTRSGVKKATFLTDRRRERIAFVFLTLPNLALIALWIYWPFVQSLYLSFTRWNPLTKVKTLVGLANYKNLLHSDVFWQVTRNTVIFTFGVVALRLVLALALAVLLNQRLRAIGLWRVAVFSPHITTTAAVALAWVAMYDPHHGPIGALFSLFGLTFPNVLKSTTLALPAVMAVAIWKGLGYAAIVFLAALQGVERELKDAASVDGANAWQSFWHISFPAISPVTYFLLITGLMGTFRTFDLISVMTGGGPLNATKLYAYYLYDEAFHYLRYGYASALAVLMFILVAAFTYAQTRAAERWVHY